MIRLTATAALLVLILSGALWICYLLAARFARFDAYGIPQVWASAGCFPMGSDARYDTNASGDELPQRRVCLTQGYWIDMLEVTNSAFQAFVEAGGYQKREYWSDEGWRFAQLFGPPLDYRGFNAPQQPRTGISYYEAEAYARWRGGRLPTEAEWEYAARGPDGRIYPWGDNWDRRRAVTDRITRAPLPVGERRLGESWIGALDMCGNVYEWVADWYGPSY